jgi:hypothetical protein
MNIMAALDTNRVAGARALSGGRIARAFSALVAAVAASPRGTTRG